MPNGEQQQAVQQQQQVVQQQQPNLYQTLGSMSPQDMLQLKHHIGVFKDQKQIIRNVGGDRAAELLSGVDAGEMTIKDAVERSKKELSPTMKEIDNMLFKEGVKSDDFLILKERLGKNWTKQERNLWFSHYNSLQRKESAEERSKYQEDKTLSSAVRSYNVKTQENYGHALKAQVDYLNIEDGIYRGFKDVFVTDKYGNIIEDSEGNVRMKTETVEGEAISAMSQEDLNMMNKHWNVIREEIGKDLNAKTYRQGDQIAVQKSLAVISNLIPESYLRSRRGIIVGDDFIPTYKEGYDIGTLRKLYYDSLNSLLTKAKNHISNTKDIMLPEQLEDVGEEGVDKWSQYMLP